jgi:hypothetical protein
MVCLSNIKKSLNFQFYTLNNEYHKVISHILRLLINLYNKNIKSLLFTLNLEHESMFSVRNRLYTIFTKTSINFSSVICFRCMTFQNIQKKYIKMYSSKIKINRLPCLALRGPSPLSQRTAKVSERSIPLPCRRLSCDARVCVCV